MKAWHFTFFVFSLCSVSSLSGQKIMKIDPKFYTSGKTPDALRVVVLLEQQADISRAAAIKGKNQKASYVYHRLVDHAKQTQQPLIEFLESGNLKYRSFYIVNMISVTCSLQEAEQLAALPYVKYVMEDGPFAMINPIRTDDRNDARAIEWNVNHIGAPSVWALGFNGQNVVIGGQDTGYEWDDATLKLKYRGWNGTSANHDYNWHDAIHEDNPMSGGSNSCGFNSAIPCDDNNHGTHTMGTMVGDDGGSNQIGIAPGAKWIGCRNMENGYGTLTTYVECFEWFLAPYPVAGGDGDPDLMPHVINNSWGCPTDEGCNTTNFPVMEAALNALRAAGCAIVVSAGNYGSSCSTVSDPAAIFDGSFSVGATNSSDAIAGFSSRGPVIVDNSGRMKPDISAPGVSVRSCIRGQNAYATWNGTSMAGPHVAALVALMISANPSLAGEVDKIEEVIAQTALHLTSTQNCGGTIPNNVFGYGRINALEAVNMVLPSNYVPYVSYSHSLVIVNNLHGLVLTAPDQTKYRIKVSNTGELISGTIAAVASGSTTIDQASLRMEPGLANIILRSPNGNYWKVVISDEGSLSAVLIPSLPATAAVQLQGDIFIQKDIKGVVLYSENGQCFLVNVSKRGKLLTIPANCP